MARLQEVLVQALAPDRFATVLEEERVARFAAAAEEARRLLAGRTVLNVNSTATGGGVAEMLQTLLAYARGVGVDTRWVVIEGNPAFFEVTKRVHNNLYGGAGDGGALDAEARAVYEKTMRENAAELVGRVRPGDVVVLHDPQTAGLAQAVRAAGAVVVWRCHIGVDHADDHSERAWAFLRPYLADVHAYVFTRRAFAPSWVDDRRLHVIVPSIDPFSTKNADMSATEVERVLGYVGLLAGGDSEVPAPFTCRDGSPGRVDRHADVLQTGAPPPAGVPLVVQVSRWDVMKDMAGVMAGFAEHVAGSAGAHLVLAGPAVTGVADDPEGGRVLEECTAAWRRLPHAARTRVHLACLPMRDPDENAVIVNALQRHAAVVVQKSLAEGFGLTVAEAMWKRRPIVASAVGGIAEQVVHGEHGLLLDDPRDLAAFGAAVRRLLEDRPYAESLGENAFRRARDEFLGDRHLEHGPGCSRAWIAWGSLDLRLDSCLTNAGGDRMSSDFTISAGAKIRDFPGETPLQALARQGAFEPTAMTSLERFSYYTAFPFAWYWACYSDELAPGEVRPTRLLARDLVLWRDEGGDAHVMDAYCPHLGANLALGGRVEGGHLVCPYHWWEYDGDGRNVRIPYSSRTNRKARVRSYPTIDRNGFVMFWYHPDPAQPPLWELPELSEYFTEEWTDFIKADWKVRCPWQELAENGPDNVHLKTVHGAATVPELERLSFEGYHSHLRSKVDFATPRGTQPGRIDTDSWGPGFALARFTGIIDTVFLAGTTPIDWEWTWSIKAYKVRTLGRDEESRVRTMRVGDALVSDLRKQMAEDNVIFDNKIHVPTPALADADGPILQFRKWARQFYVDGDPIADERARRVRPVADTGR